MNEETKAYNKNAGFFAIGIGLVEILRIFWIPVKYHKMWLAWSEETKLLTETLTAQGKTPEEIATSLPILSGLNNVQFTWCIILLVAACLSLIAAGIVAIIKSNKLSAHLAKLEEKAGE